MSIAAQRARGLVVLALAACAGTPPPAAIAPSTRPPAAEVVDLSEAPEPPGLVFQARVSHPGEALRTVLGWSHLPATGSSAVSEALVGQPAGELVDLSQPIDVAVLNGSGHALKPAWALAAGVRSVDAARAALPETLELAPAGHGTFSLRPRGGAEAENACLLGPAAGSPGAARLVCGPNDGVVGLLAPYLTRTLPRKIWESDVHAEVRAAPLKPFARMMRQQGPGLLEAMLGLRRTQQPAVADLVEAGLGDVIDLIGDLDTTLLDVKLAPEGATARLTVGFDAKASLFARLATAHPERADQVVPMFWRLPAGADTAVFSRGVDPADLAHPLDLFTRALASTADGLAADDVAAIVGAATELLPASPFVYARGGDVVAIQKALVAFEEAKAGPGRAQAAIAAAEAYVGWWAIGLDEPPAHMTSALKRVVDVWNRPPVREWLKRRVQGVPAPTLRTAAAPGLPAGTTHVELVVSLPPDEPAPSAGSSAASLGTGAPLPPRPGTARARAASTPARAQAGPLRLHAFVVPDPSGQTWLFLGADEKLATSKAKAVLASTAAAPGAPTAASGSATPALGVSAGLDLLREARQNAGGFTTLRAWVALAPEPGGGAGRRGDPLGLLAALPSQGQSPIVFTVSSQPESSESPAGALTGSVRFPRGAVEDIVLFALRSGAKL